MASTDIQNLTGQTQSPNMNDTLGNGTTSGSYSYDYILASLPVQTTMYSLILILGLPINSYVVWLILSGAGGTIASEFFYLNLTVSVMLSALEAVFYFAWLFIRTFIMYMVLTMSLFLIYYSVPLFQCCVCVERYVAVVHPVLFLRYKALWYRVVCCCAVWLTAIVIAIGFGVAMIVVSTSFMYFSCSLYLALCIACISVVSFCCFSVLRALKQPGPGEGQRDGTGGEGNNMKRRAFNIILTSLIVMVLTTLCYIPYAITILQAFSIRVAMDVTYVLVKITLFVHPLLYIHKAGKLPCFKGN